MSMGTLTWLSEPNNGTNTRQYNNIRHGRSSNFRHLKEFHTIATTFHVIYHIVPAIAIHPQLFYIYSVKQEMTGCVNCLSEWEKEVRVRGQLLRSGGNKVRWKTIEMKWNITLFMCVVIDSTWVVIQLSYEIFFDDVEWHRKLLRWCGKLSKWYGELLSKVK